jgi:hypothetical protein
MTEPTNESPRITQIPLPGRSGRIPTGAMQFLDDWPGLFIRGDVALSIAFSIRQLQKRLAEHSDMVVHSSLNRLEKIADIIERDVIVR